jgi:predicted Zn-dependent peptidase
MMKKLGGVSVMLRTLWGLAVVVALLFLVSMSTHAQKLPHERYQLNNGMTVILMQDRALPLVSVNLWYRVGAVNEPPGRSGFAHLFEHLMFMGTRRVPGSAFDDIMEAGGGANNASTSLDRTNYFSWGPSHLLPTLLWLEADRLEDLGREMTAEKLRLQVDVVRNEIRQNVENRPYGRAYEEAYQYLYPRNHPYHKGVYGTHSDLESATVSDVKDFFGSFYLPDNASLVVAGDFDVPDTKALIAKLFQDLRRGKPSSAPMPTPARLDREVRRTMFDKVRQPMINMCFHSPPKFAALDAEADLLASILASGKSSRLYQRLVVQDKIAVSVSADQEASGMGSVFRIDVLLQPDTDLALAEAALDQELARIAEAGPTESEVRERATTMESRMLTRLQSLRARADKLNEYQYYFDEPDSLAVDLDRYRSARAATVQEAAQQILKRDARLVQWVLPSDPSTSSTPREVPPDRAPASDFTVVAPKSFTLRNGIPVDFFERPGLSLLSARVVISGSSGSSSSSTSSASVGMPTVLEDASEKGLASLYAAMAEEGAGDLDAKAFSEAMAALGGSFDVRASPHTVAYHLDILSGNFVAGIQLVADAVQRPLLSEESFERVKRLVLQAIHQRASQPATIAGLVGSRVLLGDVHPYGLPNSGTEETVSRLTRQRLKEFHASVIRKEHARLLVAGDIREEELRAVLERAFGDFAATPSAGILANATPWTLPETSRGTALRVVAVDRPDAVQTVLALVAPGAAYAYEERLPLEMAHMILGGSFTSRLNRNLREVHGFTYGAGSSHNSLAHMGLSTAQTSVVAESTGPALKEFLLELTRIASGDVTEDEMAKARETIRSDLIESFGTLSGILSNVQEQSERGGTIEGFAQDLRRLKEMTSQDVTLAAQRWLDLGKAVVVLVGDRKVILEQTKDLSLPTIQWLDETGAPASPAPLPR